MNMSRRTIIEMCATALARPSVLVGVLALGSDKAIGESLQEAPQRVFSESGHSAAERAVLSAKGVLERLLGERAGEFELHWIASQNEHPVYEYSCANGVPVIRGTSGVAIARGAYMYLREYCNVMVTWGGKHLQLPAKFPDAPSTRTESPYKFVEYLNPCTFGYSTPFWKWERWEKELDWMALHGISMPLAMEGQEAVWQKVWTSFGVTQEEQDRFSVGPAYLPWHWMGNINYFEGPLPQEWIEQKANLQSNILRRMRELGMSPIAPAFAGYVPEAFLRLYPKADISALLWHKNMPQQAKTFLLHPSETKLFQEIGRRFIVEYRQMYGEVSYYLADAFNEMQPPVSKDNRYEDLRLFGKTVYDSIKAGDANATWVMQGWLFTTGGFWDKKSTEAFLSAIPNDKMIILDYANDRYIDISRDAWKRLDSFYGKPWMNGMLHTFGGNNNVKGNLPLIVQQSAQTLADSGRKNLVGWAIVMEGIETNEVCYELMADVGWSSQQIDLHNWIAKYCLARYGDYPPAIKQAWLYLLKSAYSLADSYHSRHAFQGRPSLTPQPANIDTSKEFQEATELYLNCADSFDDNILFRNDLIELVCQTVGGRIDKHLLDACKAHSEKRFADRDRQAHEAMDMMLRLDALMNVRTDRRLENWSNAARSFTQKPDEAAYYDSNARLLITTWGWSGLGDYASRLWGGLIRDYYIKRWEVFFVALSSAVAPDDLLDTFQQTWVSAPYYPSQPLHVEAPAIYARHMLKDSEKWA